jgi:hypothetical protein
MTTYLCLTASQVMLTLNFAMPKSDLLVGVGVGDTEIASLRFWFLNFTTSTNSQHYWTCEDLFVMRFALVSTYVTEITVLYELSQILPFWFFQ